VNGSQSKFLTETWPISQIEPDAPLFYLDQDRLTIDKLSALGTRLETAAEKKSMSAKPGVRSMMKIESKNSLYIHSHFTEYLLGVFEKLPRENNLKHESSSLLIW
jgi:hypothetical protein